MNKEEVGETTESNSVNLPKYLSVAIRFGVEPRDVYGMLDCALERYHEVLTIDGPDGGRRWARTEAIFFLWHAILRLLRLFLPWA
jgi:hypothetical protein